VILHEPSYVAYLPSILFNGGTPALVSTTADNAFELDPAAVEAAVTPRTKVLFLGYPCNPTGAVLEPETLQALADIAVRHDLLVVSDEIYDRLVYGDHRHVPISSLRGMRERTVLLGGFSKAYAMTGWRVGWVCAPPDLLEGIVKVHQYEIMSAPTVAQDAALVALTGAEQDVVRMVAEYDARRKMFVAGLNRIGLPTAEPKGAFYAFPSIRPTGLSSEEFSERLLFEKKVAVVPGSAFGPSGEGHVRATLATSYEQLEEALERIGEFVASLRG
jgi:aminotransferase